MRRNHDAERSLPRALSALAALLIASAVSNEVAAADAVESGASAFGAWQDTGGAPSNQTLLPPPPPPEPAATQTVQQLQHAEHADSGRGLSFVWLSPEAGFQWTSFGLFSNSDLVDGEIVPDESVGPVFGAGLGGRLVYLTAGVRFRYALLSDLHLWTLGGEVALRVPYGKFEPYAFVGGGYARGQSFEAEAAVYELGTKLDDLSLGGGFARLGGGADYFVTPVFSAGARIEADALFMSRSATLRGGSGSLYSSDGSAVGLSLGALVVLGLHF